MSSQRLSVFLLVQPLINMPCISVTNLGLDSVDLEAFEWFWLLGFSSWHGWAAIFVACEKDTSESSASE